MKFPQLDNSNKGRVVPLMFEGVNKNEIINDKELSGGINLSTKNIPAITPRESAGITKTLTNGTYYGVVDGYHYHIAGNKFYYDGTYKFDVTAGKKSIVDFNGVLVIFPDKKFYNWQEDTSGTITCPDIEFATVHYNRIFGIKDNYVYASKVGDYAVWDEFEGTLMDSWQADVYSDGYFTGIASYQDHVVFFKRNLMYELYGYTPNQFKIMETNKVGCIDNYSIAEVQGVLYFASEDDIMTYSGGFPRPVSDKLNLSDIQKVVAIGDGEYYYASIDGETYVYDMNKGVWMPYFDKEVLMFAKDGDDTLLLCADGAVHQLNSGTDRVSWEAVTKKFDGGVFNKKSVRYIKLRARLQDESTLKVYISYDEGEFSLVKNVHNTDEYHRGIRDMKIVLPIIRCNNYQLKLTGVGDAVIYGEKEVLYGSER